MCYKTFLACSFLFYVVLLSWIEMNYLSLNQGFRALFSAFKFSISIFRFSLSSKRFTLFTVNNFQYKKRATMKESNS